MTGIDGPLVLPRGLLQNSLRGAAWLRGCDLQFWDDLGMAKGYRRVDRDQLFLLPPDMREWLGEDHPVWLVIGAVGQLDTGVFHAARRTGGRGAAGYDPDMLLAVLIWRMRRG